MPKSQIMQNLAVPKRNISSHIALFSICIKKRKKDILTTVAKLLTVSIFLFWSTQSNTPFGVGPRRQTKKFQPPTDPRFMSLFPPIPTTSTSQEFQLNYANKCLTTPLSLSANGDNELVAMGQLGRRGCCKASIFETPPVSETHSPPQ